MIVQLILVLIIIFILSRIWRQYRQGQVGGKVFLAWIIFWFSTGQAVLNPRLATWVANLVGVGRGTDLVLYLAVVLVFYFIFRIFVRLDQMDKKITKIIRVIALNEKKDE